MNKRPTYSAIKSLKSIIIICRRLSSSDQGDVLLSIRIPSISFFFFFFLQVMWKPLYCALVYLYIHTTERALNDLLLCLFNNFEDALARTFYLLSQIYFPTLDSCIYVAFRLHCVFHPVSCICLILYLFMFFVCYSAYRLCYSATSRPYFMFGIFQVL